MDKYEMLKNENTKRLKDWKNKLENVREDFAYINSKESLEKWYNLSDRLQECLSGLAVEGRIKKRLAKDEKIIREMLDGFYDDGCMLDSFIYAPINLRPDEDYPAQCGYKFFDTIEEAKEYSISLGEEKDWLANAYNYILRRR